MLVKFSPIIAFKHFKQLKSKKQNLLKMSLNNPSYTNKNFYE